MPKYKLWKAAENNLDMKSMMKLALAQAQADVGRVDGDYCKQHAQMARGVKGTVLKYLFKSLGLTFQNVQKQSYDEQLKH
eukprot:4938476-Pyramimonas_sp.AAC.1